MIAEHIARKGFAPSQREIADALGLRTKNSLTYPLRALRSKGWLKRFALRSRSLTLIADDGSPLEPRQAFGDETPARWPLRLTTGNRERLAKIWAVPS